MLYKLLLIVPIHNINISTLPFLHLHCNFVLFSFIVLVALVDFK